MNYVNGNSKGEQRVAAVPVLLGYHSQCVKVATNTEDAITVHTAILIQLF